MSAEFDMYREIFDCQCVNSQFFRCEIFALHTFLHVTHNMRRLTSRFLYLSA